MSYLLNGIQLKNPTAFRRQNIDVAKDNTTLNGKKKRDFIRQKDSFTLDFKMLDQDQMIEIMTIVHGMVPVTFSVNDGNLVIPATTVWVFLDGRDYQKAEYRENITLLLEEV